jgi:hypothetical protein
MIIFVQILKIKKWSYERILNGNRIVNNLKSFIYDIFIKNDKILSIL